LIRYTHITLDSVSLVWKWKAVNIFFFVQPLSRQSLNSIFILLILHYPIFFIQTICFGDSLFLYIFNPFLFLSYYLFHLVFLVSSLFFSFLFWLLFLLSLRTFSSFFLFQSSLLLLLNFFSSQVITSFILSFLFSFFFLFCLLLFSYRSSFSSSLCDSYLPSLLSYL